MKSETKREASPHTPYKRKAKGKAKGKEIKPGANCTGLNAHVRARVAAAVDDALVAFHGSSSGPHCDAKLWANFAWRFGYGRLLDLIDQGKSEMREHSKPIPDDLKPAILQSLINPFWKSAAKGANHD